MKTLTKPSLVLTTAALLWMAPTAAAQHRGDAGAVVSSVTSTQLSILGVPLTTTTSVVGLPLTSSGLVLWLLLRDASAAYIDCNSTAVVQALAMGSGDSVGDLAALYGVQPEAHAAFGEVLRRERPALLPLAMAAGKAPGAGHGEQFVDHLARVLIANPRFLDGNRTLHQWYTFLGRHWG